MLSTSVAGNYFLKYFNYYIENIYWMYDFYIVT